MSAKSPDIQRAPDLPALIESAWRQKVLCVVLAAALGGLGWLVSRWIPAKYSATALLRLAGPQGVVSEPRESSNAQREYRHTQKELLRMSHVIRRALRFPGLVELGFDAASPDSVEEACDLIQVDLPRSSSIMRVEVSHPQADVASSLVNAAVDSYLEEMRLAAASELKRRVSTLARLHQEAEQRVGESWGNLQRLAKDIGSGDPASLSLQTQAEIENYRAHSSRLREVQSEKREALRQIEAINEDSEMLAEAMPEEASMHSVKFAMFTAKLKREQALMRGGPGHPAVKVAAQEENLLREYYQKANTEQVEEPVSKKDKLLAEPRAMLVRLQSEETALKRLLSEIEDRLDVLGGDNAARLEIARNKVARMERLADRLWQTKEGLEVEQHADNRVQLVAYAAKPSQPDLGKRNKLGLVMAGGGAGFAVLLVALAEFATGRLHTRREVSARTGLSLLGFRGALTKTVRLSPLSGSTTNLASEVDLVVGQLVCHGGKADAMTLLVTSSRSRSERGRFSEHVSAGLARTGKPTLLVELDIRELADASNLQFDLVSYVQGGTEMRAQVPSSSVMGLSPFDRVGCEKIPDEPLAILNDDKLSNLITDLKRRYRYVVIDVAAACAFPDAMHIGKLADHALVAVRRNVSRATEVVRTRRKFEALKIPVSGVLVH